MDEERLIDQNIDKADHEVMLPGFRFHPTDEELVGFYLRRKVNHKPLSIELIKQLDIYKYDPWDLPKLATTGEKEWYFYCPRDRKYRNSARPNRVTGAGFWKATGTDRPIYSSSAHASKCIGLKKSLVFYKGRAAKGIKTDWMMHEFRLPSVSDSASPKRYLDKNIPANEAWAICRIFKKANSSSQRAISHSWVSPVFDHVTTSSDAINPSSANFNLSNSPLQFDFCNRDYIDQQSSIASFSPPLHFPPTYPIQNSPYQFSSINNNRVQLINNSYKTSEELAADPKSCATINDASSLLLDMSTSILGDFRTLNEHCNEFSGDLEAVVVRDQQLDDEWGIIRSMGLGSSCPNYGLVPLSLPGSWKSNLVWDSSSPCPSDQLSTSYSTNNCYT